jgi:hypothetical protein
VIIFEFYLIIFQKTVHGKEHLDRERGGRAAAM